jgi:predicted trehalose synthase
VSRPPIAALGLRAKSGRAIAVVLCGPAASPSVLWRGELSFAGARQPYHPTIDLPWPAAQAAVRPVAARIEASAAKALAKLLAEMAAAGSAVGIVGVVGAGPRDPGRVANPHIRAHAAEGLLFRQVLEAAAAANGLRSVLFPEKEIHATAARDLGLAAPALRSRLQELGRAVGSPWRVDEKDAALAAWLVVSAL